MAVEGQKFKHYPESLIAEAIVGTLKKDGVQKDYGTPAYTG